VAGVVADTCLAFNRKCWSFDLVDRPETRPEIEVFQWSPESLVWPVKGKEKPDFVFLDPPASPEGEADGGQVRLILTSWHTNTQRTVSQAFPAKNIWDSSESFSL